MKGHLLHGERNRENGIIQMSGGPHHCAPGVAAADYFSTYFFLYYIYLAHPLFKKILLTSAS